jgi:molybdate transport system regulatory protein
MATQTVTGPRIHLRIDFGPVDAIGPGKISLLEHIDGAGSLSQAARELGMSYRQAWLLLNDVNQTFAEPVVTATAGGSGGGGAKLTRFGRELVETYRAIESDAGKVARQRLAWLADHRKQRAELSAPVRRAARVKKQRSGSSNRTASKR